MNLVYKYIYICVYILVYVYIYGVTTRLYSEYTLLADESTTIHPTLFG